MSSPLQDGSIATNDVIEAVHINQLFPILADLEDGKAFFRPDQGSANAYQVDFSGTPSNKNQFSAYHQGMLVIFKAANTNTGASTLQVVGPSGNLTAVPLTKSGSVALEADDIQAGQMVAAVCNDLGGGNFRFEMVGAPAVNLTAGDIPSGVDASKIGAGSVSNTEFGYLDGVTSGIQGQLDGKAPSSHTHAASDIASGQVALARGGTGSDLSATGGAGQVLKQSSAGGAVSVSALTAGDMPSNIDASKIGSGAVSNAEFGYLDGVTSGIQGQLDGKAASSHTHAASDIASGQVALARGGTGSDLSATGGAGQVLKQSSAGGAVSVSALTASDMPNNIDASKIGSGAVSNAEFAYLDGVTSGIQAQIDGKEPSITALPTSKGGLGLDASSASGIPKFASGAVTISGIDASDLTSGVLGEDRGGTGQSSYAKGDLLVSDGSGLNKLTVGVNNQVLIVDTTAGNGVRWSSLTEISVPSALYGDAADGDVVVSGYVTLDRTMHYASLTIQSGGVLNANGCEIYVRGLLMNNGIIHSNGQASGFVSGGARNTGPSRFLGGAGASGSGGNSNGSSVARRDPELYSSAGGNGGSSSGKSGGSGTNGNTIVSAANAPHVYRTLQCLMAGLSSDAVGSFTSSQFVVRNLVGGNGGGGGAAGAGCYGGGGGAGGDFLRIYARFVSGSGQILANGGNASAAFPLSGGAGGGGGGGGGGVVLLVSESTSHSFTLQANGGAGAGGAGGGAAGTAGGNGYTVFVGGVQ